ALYKAPKNEDVEQYGGSTLSVEAIVNTQRFKPNKDFSGVDRSKPAEPREGPVQFERDRNDDEYGLQDEGRSKGSRNQGKVNEDEEEELEKDRARARERDREQDGDEWGLDRFLHEVKTGKKPSEQRPRLGVMHAAASGS